MILESAFAFSSCGVDSGRLFNVLRKEREREPPQAKPRRLPFLPAEIKCPQRKSTGNIYKLKNNYVNKACNKEREVSFLTTWNLEQMQRQLLD
ncbi:hypothetical protein GCM10009865_38690 [Aeromicrobium ponti]